MRALTAAERTKAPGRAGCPTSPGLPSPAVRRCGCSPQAVSAYAALSSDARALVSLLGPVAGVFFAWLQSRLKSLEETGKEAARRNEETTKEAARRSEEAARRNEEAARRSEEAAKEAAKEAARRNEEAAKEAARRSEAIMDLIRNEHRKSMQDSKLSNYFVVIVSALSFLIPKLGS